MMASTVYETEISAALSGFVTSKQCVAHVQNLMSDLSQKGILI